ncbi:MAG: beta-ketoacyl-ACP synthase III [Acidimicrobiales bacterium]
MELETADVLAVALNDPLRVRQPAAGTITGWGSALPSTVISNADLEKRLDTTDAWITTRTGIRQRCVGGSVSSLAVEAGRAAIAAAGIAPAEIGLLVLATSTPDRVLPATSATVHQQLGLGGGAFDLNAVCAGFVYALLVGHGAVSTGMGNVLVIGADCFSGITDPNDRSTAVLFADGAGAIVLEPGGEGALYGFDLGVDGTGYDLLTCPQGGFISMEGAEIFRRAVRVTEASALVALDRAGVEPSEIALFVPHQANLRIIEAAASRLGIGAERTAIVLDRTGNTSAASIPMALAAAADAGRLHSGDYVLFSGFGAGMTWASAVVRWGAGDRSPGLGMIGGLGGPREGGGQSSALYSYSNANDKGRDNGQDNGVPGAPRSK